MLLRDMNGDGTGDNIVSIELGLTEQLLKLIVSDRLTQVVD